MTARTTARRNTTDYPRNESIMTDYRKRPPARAGASGAALTRAGRTALPALPTLSFPDLIARAAAIEVLG